MSTLASPPVSLAAVSGANRASWHGGYRRDASQYKRSSAMEPAPDATGAPLPGAPITPLGAFNRVERALAHKRPRAASKPAQRKQAAQGARWCTQTRGLPSDAVAIYTDVAAMRSTARLSPPPESSPNHRRPAAAVVLHHLVPHPLPRRLHLHLQLVTRRQARTQPVVPSSRNVESIAERRRLRMLPSSSTCRPVGWLMRTAV